jgi:hypothetical protein
MPHVATDRPVIYGRLKLSTTLRTNALLWVGRCPTCGRKIVHGWPVESDLDAPQHRASHCLRCRGDYEIALHPIDRAKDARTLGRFKAAPRPPLARRSSCETN